MNLNEAQNAVSRAINDNQEKIISVGRHIWKNPEPGYREFKTSEYLVKILEELGLEVETGLAVTGFRADIDTGRPGPTIAVLGELDSLILPNHPECLKETGAVHACGHNASAASLIGTAVGLLKSGILDSLCGKIALIATPAEEGIELDYRKDLMRQGKIKSIAGKSQLLREGVFNDVDISFMHHLSNHFGYNDHNGCVNKKIIFHGHSCHAAVPHNGHNALNASTLALNAIAMLREVYSNDQYIRIHGIITNGGDSVNIIPDTVTMEYMLLIAYCAMPATSLYAGFMVLGNAIGTQLEPMNWMNLFFGIFFIIIGNYLPKCKQNSVLGIRLPWTLKDAENWRKTHRLAGRVWMAGGLILLLGSFLGSTVQLPLMLSVLLALCLITTLYSFKLSKQKQRS